jgi:hypothetical protein
VYFFDTHCIDGASGCAGSYFPFVKVNEKPTGTYDEHPWTDLPAHRPSEGPDEGMGKIVTSVESFRSIDVLFHEFGHIVDLFSFANTIGFGVVGSGCAGPGDMMCEKACVLDSTDESEALKETVADFLGIFAIGRLYTGLTYDSKCSAIASIANSGVSTPVHGPECVVNASQIRSFLNERPTEPGVTPPEDGLLPTGKCGDAAGYRQGALVQAWWEWTHGQDCDAGAPFTCATFGEESFGATTGIEAMLYALNLGNSTFYRKLLTDAETYIQCVYGDALATRWRAIWCHHEGLSCDSLPSPCPGFCGDGVAGGDEECDQHDMAEKTCQDFGFAGGALSCKSDCTFDPSQCEPLEVPTTGEMPTTGMSTSSDGSSGETSPDSATAGGGGVGTDAGCGCATGVASGAWLLGLAPLILRRRRRRCLDRHLHAR